MNSNTLLNLLQTGFRVSLGATTSLVETIQDPQKREESLYELRTQLSQRVIEWAEKGAVTEQEARRFIEQIWNQSQSRTPGGSSSPETPPDLSTSPSATATSPNAQLEIEELTAQIAAIRTELEKLRNTGSDN